MPYIINTRNLDGLSNVQIIHIENKNQLLHSIKRNHYGVELDERLMTGKVQVVSDVGGVLFEYENDIATVSELTHSTYEYLGCNIKQMFITHDSQLAILIGGSEQTIHGDTLYTLPINRLTSVENNINGKTIRHLQELQLRGHHTDYEKYWGELDASFIGYLSVVKKDEGKSMHVIPKSSLRLNGEFVTPPIGVINKQKFHNIQGVRGLDFSNEDYIRLVGEPDTYIPQDKIYIPKDSNRVKILINDEVLGNPSYINIIPLDEFIRHEHSMWGRDLVGILINEA